MPQARSTHVDLVAAVELDRTDGRPPDELGSDADHSDFRGQERGLAGGRWYALFAGRTTVSSHTASRLSRRVQHNVDVAAGLAMHSHGFHIVALEAYCI